MVQKTALFFALAFSALLAFAQDEHSGLIEGTNWAFLVSAPEGWVWDSHSLRAQGIWGLFYKEGTSYSPSKLHIYINPTPKKPDGPTDLKEFIDADEATYMAQSQDIPEYLISDIGSYSPGMEYRFALKDFDDRTECLYQSLAYYEGEEAFFVFVLFCRSAQERDRERASFMRLLDSFTYIKKE